MTYNRRIITVLAAVLLFLSAFSYAYAETRDASLKLVKKDGRAFDLRKEAGQKLYRYDTLQGACADDGYAYMTLYNRGVEKCRIVKVELDGMKVRKVSKPLNVYHANNLTYNTKKDLIVATCCRVKPKRAVFVDPDTLKVVGKKDIRLTKRIKNIPNKEIRDYSGFTAIAYNEKKDTYVGRLRGSGNVIIFDGKLRPKRYVKLKGKKKYLLNQGMDTIGRYIYDVRSFKGKHKYSMVTVHTMSGKFVGQVKFPYGRKPGRELQCVFHDGEDIYTGTYYTTSQKNDTKKNRVKRKNRLYRVGNMI